VEEIGGEPFRRLARRRGNSRPWSLSPAPSWWGSGTCSPIAARATTTSVPATVPSGSTRTTSCVTTSASSNPWLHRQPHPGTL